MTRSHPSAEPGRELTRTIGVAVAIPPPYGPELQAWRRSFGDPLAEVIPPHITLLPPTEVAVDELAEVVEHLADVAASATSFEVRLRGTATFRPVSPVVFVALSRGISDCEMLSKSVRTGPLPVELNFPYHPHVTVAHHLPDEALDRAFNELSAFQAEFSVDAFWLYEHQPDGVWMKQQSFPLGSG